MHPNPIRSCPRIHQLSPSVVNKIAAGEVIERPASVVKELLENSVDAGATRIDVRLEKGGSEVIRVADDGCGIAADETAAGRGEPCDEQDHVGRRFVFASRRWASAARRWRRSPRSSRLLDYPQPHGREHEWRRVGSRRRRGEARSRRFGCPVGTTIEVRNLFFNTPVRHKFLRSAQTEMGHSIEAMTRLALAHPHIHFTLAHNGRTIHDLPPATTSAGELRRSLAMSWPTWSARCGSPSPGR